MARLPITAIAGTSNSGYVHLGSTLLAAPAASFSLTGIGATYLELRVITVLEPVTDGVDIFLRPNNDSGGNYIVSTVEGTGAAIQPNSGTAQTGAKQNVPPGGSFPQTNDRWLLGVNIIGKYAAGTRAIIGRLGIAWDNSGNVFATDAVTLWNNTASLINRVDIIASSGNLATGSLMRVEGLAP